MTQSADSHAQIDQILRFIEALHADPQAAPPPGLDAADIALARDLARTYPRSALGTTQRQRIWQRALAQTIQQRLAQGSPPAQSDAHIPAQSHSQSQSRSQSNGHYARQETKSMFSQPTTVHQPLPRQRVQPRTGSQQPRTRGLWITSLIAAVSALVIGGLIFAGLGDSSPSATNPNTGPNTNPNMGAGVNDTGQDQDAQVTVASATPTATATLTPTATHTATATAIFDPGMTETAIHDAITDLLTTVTPTVVPLQPSPFMATATPIPMGSGGYTDPTMLPTAVPFFPPTLSPEDLKGIEQWLVIDEVAIKETLWSHDGRYLFVAHDDSVDIHDMQSPQVRTASGHQGTVTTIALNPFGTVLATGAEDGEVHLYILPDAQAWVGLEICDCTITEVTFSPTGSHVVVRTEDGALYLYALPGGAYYP